MEKLKELDGKITQLNIIRVSGSKDYMLRNKFVPLTAGEIMKKIELIF